MFLQVKRAVIKKVTGLSNISSLFLLLKFPRGAFFMEG
jgi:hypothetical protein